jgi:hypothetical protein
LLNPSKGVSKSKDFASAAVNSALTTSQYDDIPGYQLAKGITAQDPNSNISGTGGSQGAYTKTGLLLNEAQRNFFLNQNLDIA